MANFAPVMMLLLLTCNVIILKAFESVVSITVAIGDGKHAAATGVQLTLWFDTAIYQFTLDSAQRNTTYSLSSTEFFTIGQSDCMDASDAKIMIEKDGGDAVEIDSVQFETDSGEWYGIDAYCADDGSDIQYYLDAENGYFDWIQEASECPLGYAMSIMCVDNENDDCGPEKQILYFDTSKPNQSIPNAERMSGIHTVPQIVTCPPTKYTNIPTNIPTTLTNVPTNIPSLIPTIIPTDNPSEVPTNIPTYIPTNIPSLSTTIENVDEQTVDERNVDERNVDERNVDEQNIFTTERVDESHEKNVTFEINTYIVLGAIFFAIVILIFGIVIIISKIKKYNADVENMGREKAQPKPMAPVASKNPDNVDIYREEVRAQTLLDWFTNVVELPQYFRLFVNNGYDSFHKVEGIQNEEEIRNIGITKRGHVLLIMSGIRDLQNKVGLGGGTAIGTNMEPVAGEDIAEHSAMPYTKEGGEAKEQIVRINTEKPEATEGGDNAEATATTKTSGQTLRDCDV